MLSLQEQVPGSYPHDGNLNWNGGNLPFLGWTTHDISMYRFMNVQHIHSLALGRKSHVYCTATVIVPQFSPTLTVLVIDAIGIF